MPPGEHEFLPPSSTTSSSKDDHGHGGHSVEPSSQRLTNADFRKILMTPRSSGFQTPSGSLGAGHYGLGSTSSNLHGSGSKQRGIAAPASTEKAEKRKKKKSYYAKLKRQEDDKMAELAAKYRDRAKERREGIAGPAAGEGGPKDEEDGAKAPQSSASTSGYRAVAPDLKSSHDAAERRKQLIQESKFLGGDMEHTHLVKGLDFALLQKVRSEISTRERVADEEEESDTQDDEKDATTKSLEKDGKTAENENEVTCRTVVAKNIVRTVFNTDLPERNELFFPGRMAYLIDLEEDNAADDGEGNPHSDIPTTTIRSKADVQSNLAHQQAVSMSANDIVINKLTQILSYLRAAGGRGKKKKKDKLISQPSKSQPAPSSGPLKSHGADVPIFDDEGEYVPSYERRDDRGNARGDKDRDRDRDRERDRDRRDRDHGRDRDRKDRDKDRDRRHRNDRQRDRQRDKDNKDRGGKEEITSYFDRKEVEEEFKGGFSAEDKTIIKGLLKREEEKTKKEETQNSLGQMMVGDQADVYAECYPDVEMNYAMDDSDDEVDYTKMDLGNKKGPVGRWDFDTAEEYADYMSQKEAMPKAAFQYGVKMAEGRKTRGKVGVKNEKAKLDKEWNKISAILDKRKASGAGGSSAKRFK